jgi:MFS family permease
LKFNVRGNLWTHRDFARLWFSDTVSQFGTQFSGLALPILAVLEFDATPFEMGVLAALAIIPYPALGLFVGVWADRFRKRRIMVVCNFGRMLTLASVPVSFLLGTLSLAQIFAVALVSGVFSVFFDISYQAYLPLLVERTDLVEGNQKLQLSGSAAQVAGPGMAGLVYQAIGGALTVAADAFGYLVSAVALLTIKKAEPVRSRGADAARPDFFAEMKEGAAVVLGNPLLRSLAGCTATSNLGTYMVSAVLTLFALRDLRFSAAEVGLMGSIGAAGFLLGAVVVNAVTRRFGFGRSLAVSISFSGLYVLCPLALYGYPFLVLSAVAFVFGVTLPIYNINQISLRQAITPDRLLGRMNATMRTIIWGTIPVGALLGGILGNTIGLVDVFYLGGAIGALSCLWIFLGPVIHLKVQPGPAGDAAESQRI